jgi:hypothetical protein
MTVLDEQFRRLSLREQVEMLLPAWQSWYPSLFHAAEDLGLIRARVCSPDSLMLSSRHASVQAEAMESFKQQWSVEDEPELPPLTTLRLQHQAYRLGQQQNAAPGSGNKKRKKRKKKKKSSAP